MHTPLNGVNIIGKTHFTALQIVNILESRFHEHSLLLLADIKNIFVLGLFSAIKKINIRNYSAFKIKSVFAGHAFFLPLNGNRISFISHRDFNPLGQISLLAQMAEYFFPIKRYFLENFRVRLKSYNRSAPFGPADFLYRLFGRSEEHTS